MASIGLTVVVALHLTVVYVAMMGPLVCLWLQWRARRDDLAARLDRYFLRLSVLSMLVAAMLGGLALLLIGRLFPSAYLAAARVLPERRYWYGGVELVFSLGCFVLALATPQGAVFSRTRFWIRWLATLLGGTNLVYHFPTLFVMLGVLCVRPDHWGHEIKFTALLADGEVLARVAHHLFAALVVTGMAAAWYGARRGREESLAIVWGARLSAIAMVCQLLSGLWLVMALPVDTRQRLLGEDTLAAGLFGLSLLATLVVLPRLVAMALGHVERRHAFASLALLLVTLLLMTATRHQTRELLLAQQRLNN